MTTNEPRPGQNHPGYSPGSRRPLPQQANPTWLGHVQPEYYRQAPAPDGGPFQPVRPAAVTPVLPPVQRRRGSAGVVGLVVGGGFLAFMSLFLVLPFLLGSTGGSGFVIGFIASLIPLATVLLTVRFIDRWEPEPKPLLLFAFGWGSVVSIAVTILLQPYFSLIAGPASGLDSTTFAVTVQAPVVEEFAKSLGLLLLLLLARKHFDGPVDGVVFAFTIAAGFAFTENILYFGRAIAVSSDPGTDLAVVFFLRGVMSPFAHAIFTGTTGLILGFAARRGGTGLMLLAFVVGLVPAMLLHSGWNSMGRDFLAQYLLVQVPIFLLAVVVIVLLRVAERRLTRQRLKEYAAAGWFTAAEVDMLATAGGRRAALRWARSIGRGPQMKALLRSATDLAFTRQRILSGRDVPAHQLDEQHQLAGIGGLRAAVLG
ncbi:MULTISPECIES: PrsW family intramembrane metalloprotease [unclassified Arthrobacter]|uniref:PrsW family intramembrane metalloprotease n=1 Tax=unclassified Arthrobacter TaxID=235627 RepID=UPI002E0584CB|nr:MULTISPECIES: PrsW family intramembrane metalloprotease [unclassified Arthrobacter]MEC5192187.1 RsiW-degrading membrane proteinase PrsW (M82 family) [Arthrobacter sp. MP_M4]MEC5203207.1 RsiW-degrading membrane proteinase PrsW (M82 family) [Arthrobacter sp. MP_M7]